MNRLITFLLATTVAGPALAQHAGHGQTQNANATQMAPSPASAPACTPEHAAMGHCKMPAPAAAPAQTCTPEHAVLGHCKMPAPATAPAQTCTPEHAAMGHCKMPAPAAAPAQTCTPEHAAMGHCKMPAQPTPPPAADPHAGHQMGTPAQPADPHAGHDMATMPSPVPPVAPPPAEALSGPAYAADLVFNPAEMAHSRAELAKEHGGLKAYKFLVDQLEAKIRNGRDVYAWDAQFWYGGDIDKFWLKTEGEGEFGAEFEGVEVQGLWSHAVDPWFDLQAGIRQDFRSGPDRTQLVLGFQGLAPYWFEVEGAVFLSTKGDLTARFEGEYDLRLTQELILQPTVEADFSLQDISELGIGSGLSTAELGARLRYEMRPRNGAAVVSPYVGVQYERAFGDTAGFRRAAGEDVGGWSLLLGVRTWF